MSSDDGIIIGQNSRGNWVGLHYFASDDTAPDLERARPQFSSLEYCLSFWKEAIVDTEYGLKIVYPEGKAPGIDEVEPPRTFLGDLRKVINYHSLEGASGTPDYILAEYLFSCLQSYNKAIQDRELLTHVG